MNTTLFASLLAATLLVSLGAREAHAESNISGTISFKGTPPQRKELKRKDDPVCAKNKRLAEDVIVTSGKLKDVHVRIKFGTAGKHRAPTSPAMITQSDCMYEPRVIGVLVDQEIAIRNKDHTLHNVRGILEGDTLFNLAQPPKSKDIVRKEATVAGEILSIRCDVHKWMQSYVVVSDHPYFAVSAENGTFTIKNAPVGTHTIEAWHPTLGLKSQKITVTSAKNATANFSY